MHHNRARPGFLDDATHLWFLEPCNVIHHTGAGLQGFIRHFSFARVDRYEDFLTRRQCLNDGQYAPQFLIDWYGRGPRPAGFSAYVNEIGSSFGHGESGANRLLRCAPASAIREGVWRDVQDAHQEGASAEIESVGSDFPEHQGAGARAVAVREAVVYITQMSSATSLDGVALNSCVQSANPYETNKLLSEYLLFHYGTPSEVLPFEFGPSGALNYPVRCVLECVVPELTGQQNRALDLGCAVGRSTFELAKHFRQVVGVDYSRRFIEAAEMIRTKRALAYERIEEGALRTPSLARLPEDVDPDRVRFEQGDAMSLRDDLGIFDVVLMANLIDRLSEPLKCLTRLPSLVRAGGLLAITSPYTWSEEYTPKALWLGGVKVDGDSRTTMEGLKLQLEGAFDLVFTRDVPFLIREHARKYQWSVAQASVWRRKV